MTHRALTVRFLKTAMTARGRSLPNLIVNDSAGPGQDQLVSAAIKISRKRTSRHWFGQCCPTGSYVNNKSHFQSASGAFRRR